MSVPSVFLVALGVEAERLHPAVLAYASCAEPGWAPSGVSGELPAAVPGVAEGVFSVAGSRFGRANLLLVPILGRRLLMTAHGRNVPFTLHNRPAGTPAHPELHAEREFRFTSGAQGFVDVLTLGAQPGTLRNLLGEARRLEVELRCWVDAAGSLRLDSQRASLRFGRFRLRLRGPFSVRAELENGYERETGRLTVRARVSNPLAGAVLEYIGAFTYRASPQNADH